VIFGCSGISLPITSLHPNNSLAFISFFLSFIAYYGATAQLRAAPMPLRRSANVSETRSDSFCAGGTGEIKKGHVFALTRWSKLANALITFDFACQELLVCNNSKIRAAPTFRNQIF
jgi:hypothetical protein